jgi:2-oxoglutarate/2-oxoacid ferredoxin oxidoreductase subunit beta
MVSAAELLTPQKIQWCPGCGNFGIMMALKNAVVNLNLDPDKLAMVSGIGCSGKMPHYVRTYGFETLHGRVLPVAEAIRMANNGLTVIASGGDGDGYGIGMGHFMHAMRRNYNIAYFVHDNMVYGLTKGQVSPTSEKGYKSPTTPFGSIEVPVNPLALAITQGCTFVARGFAGDVKHLTWLMEEAIKHRGFALVDIFQPCVTFNKVNTYQFFQNKVYNLQDVNHDTSNKFEAWKKSQEWNEKIPIGIFYKENRTLYEDELPQIKDKPLVQHDISNVDITPLYQEFM